VYSFHSAPPARDRIVPDQTGYTRNSMPVVSEILSRNPKRPAAIRHEKGSGMAHSAYPTFFHFFHNPYSDKNSGEANWGRIGDCEGGNPSL
jgi:hypothetical protein